MDTNIFISKYTQYGNAIKRLENESQFRKLEESLVRTLNYLGTRFAITNTYNYFESPTPRYDSSMLFKIYNRNQMIMYVYFTYSVNARYLSIEVANSVNSIVGELSGFDEVVRRKTPPPLKFIFSDFTRIETSLVKICDFLEGGSIICKTQSVSDDINTPLRPKTIIRKADGSVRYVCGRCEESFLKSQRCPECGQLVKEQ